MGTFHFRLQRVLDWWSSQRAAEERRLQQMGTALEHAESALEQARAARNRTELATRALEPLKGTDLAALSAYQLGFQKRELRLIRECHDCRERLLMQRQRWLEIRQKCRLIEELKVRRLSEFGWEMEQEIENAASESHLAQWSAKQSGQSMEQAGVEGCNFKHRQAK